MEQHDGFYQQVKKMRHHWDITKTLSLCPSDTDERARRKLLRTLETVKEHIKCLSCTGFCNPWKPFLTYIQTNKQKKHLSVNHPQNAHGINNSDTLHPAK